jgi:predicted nuclease of predicted toxin-antitoxin system
LRLLVDNNLPPGLVQALKSWDVVHAKTIGLQAAPDEILFDLAAREKRILVSQDADFGALLARMGVSAPSVALIRRPDLPTIDLLGPFLQKELPPFQEALDRGCLLVFDKSRIRCRRLPLIPG